METKEITIRVPAETTRRYEATSEETRREFVVALTNEATFVEPTEQIERCRDPDDDKFLELAAAGDASAIVSGDDDLLVLDTSRDIPILKGKAFLKSVERGDV